LRSIIALKIQIQKYIAKSLLK